MKEKKSFFKIPAVQTLLISLICILLGLLVGFIVLLIINPANAWEGLVSILKNFWNSSKQNTQLKNLGNTLVKTAPLLMCSLSVLFAYKAGLFNIGAAGQYVVGAGAALYMALALHLPWWVCLLGAIVAGAVLGAISGALKAYFNVNEVISCIMLNWISLYLINMLLGTVKETTSNYTAKLSTAGAQSFIPDLGLGAWFGKNAYVGLALFLAVLSALLIWMILQKTRLGYELKASGYNRNAARYCGMKEKKNMVLTMAIAGSLAGAGAGLFYLTGFEQWSVTQTSVPSMGFNGIAAAFLGGLNPIGSIFSSYFIQHIADGGAKKLTTLGYPSQISELISSMIIYLCAFVMFFKTSFNNILDRAAERRQKAKEAQKAENDDPSEKETETDEQKGGEEA